MVCRKHGSSQQRLQVDHSTFLIGRDERCQLRLKSRTVSRRHCMVRIKSEGVFIRDLGSRHGTIVNGARIPAGKRYPLWHHDQVRIGRLVFRISIRDSQTNVPITVDSATDSHAAQSHRVLPEPTRLMQHGLQSSTTGESTFEFLSDPDGASQLFDELDAIASSLSTDSTDMEDPPDPQTQLTRDTVKSDPVEEHDTKIDATESTDNGPKSSGESEQDDHRIPKHLRPKAPVDSQQAATETLRKLFER